MLDGSFATAMADCPADEKDTPVPNGDEFKESIEKGLETLKIYYDNALIGAVVIALDTQTNINKVELLFISPDSKGKGLGTKAWQAIEKTYPNTEVWCLITPYFLKRNVHFYVNKCGFAITKYYNKWNPMKIGDVRRTGSGGQVKRVIS